MPNYRLKHGKHRARTDPGKGKRRATTTTTYRAGDVIEMSPAQARPFKDMLELVDEEATEKPTDAEVAEAAAHQQAVEDGLIPDDVQGEAANPAE